ncbi:SLAC1 anion channel family protein [Massilia pinisoli]|uniref:SLAC1 anion channel family protein n=1 Tax=Massilia pinisoli TaxID=1772194 RepID=A0ABT1ZSB9_9BURK|nr:SLAC1 anion channel family protein [Massilia pinisoli]MCS0582821.1 SLAC1 anion channel family protein [Massilia pinisoli]
MQAAHPAGVTAPAAAPAVSTTLAYLPVGTFGAVMGLTGLSLAWRLAHQAFGAPAAVGQAIGVLALVSFVVLAVAYGIKAAAGFYAVRAEFAHPVAGNLFGTPLISLLLLPFLLADVSLALARLAWVLGAAGMTVFAWTIVMRWLSVRHAPTQVAPAWIVPVVGMLDIPLAVPVLRWDGLHGVMVFGLAVGLFFALPLLAMVLHRLVTEEPLPVALQPSLLILVAPFAVGFSAYVATFGHVDAFAQGLVMVMLFLLPVLLGRLAHLPARAPFRLAWWAGSFPLAAAAVASLRYASVAGSAVMDAIALVVLGVATLVIGMFGVQTVRGILAGKLRELS